jgi:hypothetical protein
MKKTEFSETLGKVVAKSSAEKEHLSRREQHFFLYVLFPILNINF